MFGNNDADEGPFSSKKEAYGYDILFYDIHNERMYYKKKD